MRKFTARPNSIKAATGLSGSEISINTRKVEQIQKALQTAYDLIEELDDDSFQATQGENMMDDLDIWIRQCDYTIRWAKGEEI